jgi:hypothetical protein
MGLDQQGYFWLSDPWVAASAILVAVGLLLWCHRSLGSGDSGRAVAVPVRAGWTPPAHRRTAPSCSGKAHLAAVKRERRDAKPRRVA